MVLDRARRTVGLSGSGRVGKKLFSTVLQLGPTVQTPIVYSPSKSPTPSTHLRTHAHAHMIQAYKNKYKYAYSQYCVFNIVFIFRLLLRYY